MRCSFCYLGEAELWQREQHMPENEVLRWIEWAGETNIPAVRFTGGEATLHPKITLFCNYAYLQKRWIILNTNAMADDRFYDEVVAKVHDYTRFFFTPIGAAALLLIGASGIIPVWRTYPLLLGKVAGLEQILSAEFSGGMA